MAVHDDGATATSASAGETTRAGTGSPVGTTASATASTTVSSRPAPSVMKALLWMLVSLLGFTMTAIAGREAGRVVPPINMVFWRNGITLVVLLIAFRCTGVSLASLVSRQPGMQIARALAHFAGQLAWMKALMLIPLVQLFAIEFTTPLWVAVLAPAMLAEKLTNSRIMAAVMGFIGVLVVVRPGFANVGIGTGFAVLCAILFAFNLIGTRYLTRRDGAFTILMYMAVNHTVLAFVLGWGTLAMPDRYTALWLVILGFASLAAHFGLARAVGYADAVVVAPMDFMRLPLIAVIGAIAYNEPLVMWVAVGAAIVVAANVVNLVGEKWRPGKPA